MDSSQASDVVTGDVSYLSDVNFFEAVLIFVGIPLVIIVGVALLTVVPNRSRSRPTYRPGSSWDYSDRFYTGDTPVQVPSHLIDSPLGGARGTW